MARPVHAGSNAGVEEPRRYTFRKAQRLGGKKEFATVFDGPGRRRDTRGPLVGVSVANELGHARLGISIGRKVGTAPVRNRIKRLLRESFRLLQHDWPRGIDLVIVVRPHMPMLLADYQKILSGMMVKICAPRADTRPPENTAARPNTSSQHVPSLQGGDAGRAE